MNTIIKVYKKIASFFLDKRTEWVVFLLMIAANATYLLLFRYIPSLDGPQHLYNSNVIVELIKGNDFFKQYFVINNVLVGYWNAHAYMSLLNWIFPSWLCEKIFLITTMLAIPLAFRYLVKSVNPKVNYLSLLILPFLMHSYFFMGYYAFCFAWIFFFLTLGYFIRNYNRLNIKRLAILLALFFLTYLSHLIIYSFVALFIVFFILFRLISELIYNKEKYSVALKKYGIITLKTLLVALPSIIFAIIYTLHVFKLNANINHVEFESPQLFSDFYNLSSLVAFNHNTEGQLNTKLFGFIMGLGVFAIVGIIINKIKKTTQDKKHLNLLLFWGIMSILALTIFFVFPNTFGTGSVSKRMLVFFSFVYISWLAMNRLPGWVQLLAVGVVIWYGVGQTQIRYPYYKNLDTNIRELVYLEDFMEDNSTYTSINCIPMWNNVHFLCYVGSEKKLIYLRSPQNMGHFPVVWNFEEQPNIYMGLYSAGQPGTNWFTGTSDKPIQMIDYIVIHGNWVFDSDPAYNGLRNKVQTYYELVTVSEHGYGALYKFKLDDYLDAKIVSIQQNPGWMKNVEARADRTGMSIHNVLILEALYSYSLSAK